MKFLNASFRKLFFLFGLLGSSLCFAQSVYLTPEEINEGDTARLIIEIEDATPSLHELDTTKLEKDFEILGTSSSVQMVQIQNKITNLTRWEIELFPLKTGKLEIPALSINGVDTQTLVLTVKKPDANSAGATAKDVFIEVSAEPENPYVGQQTNIVVKLYHNIRIVNGTLSEPEAVNADVYRIGNDISYVQTVNGNRYNVLERTFALFTNAPGESVISPVSFRGQIESDSDDISSSLNTFMRQVRQIKRSGNDLTLNVRDIPTSFTGKYWLPANDLRISQQWSNEAAELNVGDSLNRTLKIIADGLPAEALPEDLYSENSGLVNVYPDKASRSNQDIGKKLVGKIEQKFAMILPKSGYVTIPELRLKWWDLDEDIEKEAVLPERVLIVSGDTTIDNSPADSEQLQSVAQSVNQNSANSLSAGINYWQWIAALLFLLWLTTLYFWQKSRRIDPQAQEPAAQPESTEFNRNSLKLACQSNDPINARNQLITWARQYWPEKSITGLFQIKRQALSTVFIDELARLDEVLFSSTQDNWSGQDLWEAFLLEQQTPAAENAVQSGIIPPLYSK